MFRERFERETKANAGLNHPHICTLHDVGRQGGTDYLVLQHLEGETLLDKILAAIGAGVRTLEPWNFRTLEP